MKYDGEKFLLKLYKDMYNDENIKSLITKSNTEYEAIKKYIDRLERVHEKAIKHKTDTGLKLLKNFYYDKYVIKKENIPDSYINYLDKALFDKYNKHLEESQKEELKNSIINNQKNSLDEWIDYFTSEESKSYPTWAKYWAFQEILKIGDYDPKKETYNERNKSTTAPFPKLNKEALTKTLDLITKEVNKEKLEEKDIEKLVQNSKFSKLYTAESKLTKENNSKEEEKIEWVKIEQTTDTKSNKKESLFDKFEKDEQMVKYIYTKYKHYKPITKEDIRIIYELDDTLETLFVGGDPRLEEMQKNEYRRTSPDLDTKEKALAAVKESPVMLRYMPKEILDNEVAMTAIKNNTMAIMYIPKELINKDIAVASARANWHTIEYIPEELRTKDVILAGLQNSYLVLRYYQADEYDKDIALAAIKNDGQALKYLRAKDGLIDKEMAMMAVKDTGYALKYVPKELIDKELALTAVQNEGLALEYVSKELIDKELVWAAIKEYGGALGHVPKELIDKELVWAAIQDSGAALKYVPREMINKELAQAAVKKDWLALKYVPKELIDIELAMTAVRKYEDSLEYVPDNLKEEVKKRIKQEKLEQEKDKIDTKKQKGR